MNAQAHTPSSAVSGRRPSGGGFTGLGAIFRRELQSLFLQPLAWILLAIGLLLGGWLFSVYLKELRGDVRIALSATFGRGTVFWVLLAILPPLLTMRMLAEEAKSGVLEFLLTAPVSDAAVVLGKMLAATTFFAILWSSGLLYGLGLLFVDAKLDLAQLLLAYVGAVLLSALFCAIGLFASSLTSTPALAAFLAFLIGLLFLGAPWLLSQVEWLAPEWRREIGLKVDVIGRYGRSFLSGVLDTGHLVFYLVWTAVFLFLAVRRLEMQRWA